MKVYIALGCIDYEGTSNLKVFKSKESARKYIKIIKLHEKKRPKDYGAKYMEWNNTELSGHCGYDGYEIEEREVYE